MKLKQKIPYNIRKSLVKILPWAMLLGAPVTTSSCGKDPMPTRKVVIDWDWEHFPNSDTVRLCAKQKDVDSIILNLRDYNTTAWTPWLFNGICNELEKVFNIAPKKTRGHGTIIVGHEGGAQMQSTEPGQCSGMSLYDSIRCTNWGFLVMTEQIR